MKKHLLLILNGCFFTLTFNVCLLIIISMGIGFFDYTAFTPKEELQLALERTYSGTRGNFCSLEGRLVCLIRVITHVVSIVLKPLYYLVSCALGRFTIIIMATVPDAVIASQNSRKEKSALDAEAIANNPELQQRFHSNFNGLVKAAPLCFLSQIIQMCKAALGILHPGLYFKNDNLAPYFRLLANEAKELNLHPELIQKLNDQSVILHHSLRQNPGAAYYCAEFEHSLDTITKKFPNLPRERKIELLSTRLNPEVKGEGLNACPSGLARTLQILCIEMDFSINSPEELQAALIKQFYSQILTTMIDKAEYSKGQITVPSWAVAVRSLAHDPAHRENTLILTLGRDYLSEDLVQLAEQDIMAHALLEERDKAAIVEIFTQLSTPQEFEAFVLQTVNRGEDGSLGIPDIRNYIVQMAISKTGNDINYYFLNDFNIYPSAIHDFLSTLSLPQDECKSHPSSQPSYYDKQHRHLQAPRATQSALS